MYTNDTVGGLLNASFGNATEVIISGGWWHLHTLGSTCLPDPTPRDQGGHPLNTSNHCFAVSAPAHNGCWVVSACSPKPRTVPVHLNFLAELHVKWSEGL